MNNAALDRRERAGGPGPVDPPVAAAAAGRPQLSSSWAPTVAAGTGKAVVVATGAATEFGRIFRLAADAPRVANPAAAAGRRRWPAGSPAVALVVGARDVRRPGRASGSPLVASFVFALGVMVALVPEGLPATLSVSLAIGVRRMARRHALVKRLLAVEALGSTTVICTDKTGTLTQAEMTVTEVWAGGRSMR